MTNTHTGKVKIDQKFIDDATDTIEKAIAKIESLEADKRRLKVRERVLTEVLRDLIPIAINEGPGGCDGKTSGCPNCEAIRRARTALSTGGE